jgi:hypothetical protein
VPFKSSQRNGPFGAAIAKILMSLGMAVLLIYACGQVRLPGAR